MTESSQQAPEQSNAGFVVTAAALSRSANFLFKQKYGKFFGIAVLISLIGHIAFILGMPAINPEIVVQQETSMEAVDLPPEVVIPPPPKTLAKPSIPQMAEEEIDEDITIEETTPPPPDLIPEMPTVVQEEKAEEFLMVAETMPKFKTVPKQPKMPSYIARARVDVTTLIDFYVLKDGSVDQNRTSIVKTSGYPELDEIAAEWAKKIKFHPALNRGEPVQVRVRVPVQWKSR
jgi:periplasmic protein TonB